MVDLASLVGVKLASQVELEAGNKQWIRLRWEQPCRGAMGFTGWSETGFLVWVDLASLVGVDLASHPGVDLALPLAVEVTAARDPGRVTAILYSRLATSLRSLAIIVPIHLHLLSLAFTFATVSL